MTGSRLSLPAAAGRHAVLMGMAVFMLMPFVWMISLSIRPPNESFGGVLDIIPDTFYGVENYTAALTEVPLPRFLLNGVIVTGAILLIQVIVATPCAYALAKLRIPGRELLFALVLVGLLIPHQVLAIPLFLLFHWFGILNTYAALVLPFAVSPFAIFLFRQFFKSVPDDLIHSARLDGLGELAIIWHIMLPAARPAVIAFGILSVVGHWNDLFWPLIAVHSEHLMTPPLGIVRFHSEEMGNAYGPLMAAATLVIAPLVLAFLFAQRRFVEGVTLSGMK